MAVSNVNAHTERGRVERRIQTLRESLEKLGVQTLVPMTCMQWDCLFTKISNSTDDLPIARGDFSRSKTLDIKSSLLMVLKWGEIITDLWKEQE